MPSHLRRYDEAGHVHFLTISCYRRLPFFGTAALRDIVVGAMRDARSRVGFRWIGYVIMPEHVHWLCYPHPPGANDPIPISRVIESLKTSIGKRVKAALREAWASRRSLGTASLDQWATSSAEHKPIWTTRGIDLNLTTRDKLEQKLFYCHRNPVRRGLVERAEDWPWSSYRHYEMSEPTPLAMDWDGSWPIA